MNTQTEQTEQTSWKISQEDREAWQDLSEYYHYMPDVPEINSDLEEIQEFVKFSLAPSRFDYLLKFVKDYEFRTLDGYTEILIESEFLTRAPSSNGQFIPLIVIEYEEGFKLVDGFHRYGSLLKGEYPEVDYNNIECIVLKLEEKVSLNSLYYEFKE